MSSKKSMIIMFSLFVLGLGALLVYQDMRRNEQNLLLERLVRANESRPLNSANRGDVKVGEDNSLDLEFLIKDAVKVAFQDSNLSRNIAQHDNRKGNVAPEKQEPITASEKEKRRQALQNGRFLLQRALDSQSFSMEQGLQMRRHFIKMSGKERYRLRGKFIKAVNQGKIEVKDLRALAF